VDINARHDATLAFFERRIAEMPKGSAERKRAEHNRPATVLFVDAFLPRRDCDKYADRLVKQ
jgi:hypothetical protein